jgi:hypothetical protein
MILICFLIFICFLLAAFIIILFSRERKKKEIFFIERETSERPWVLVEKGPDSTFTEETEKEDKRD